MAAPGAGEHFDGVPTGVVAKLEQQSEGKLGHRCRAIGGDVGDNDALLFGGRDVDNVVTSGQYADVTGLRKLLQGSGRKWRFVGEQDLGTAGAFNDGFGRRAIVDDGLGDLMQSVPGEVPRVQRITVQNHRRQLVTHAV